MNTKSDDYEPSVWNDQTTGSTAGSENATTSEDTTVTETPSESRRTTE